MIDISDGLSSDLKHLCDSSGVGATIIAENIPMNLNLRKLVRTLDEQLDLALNGGEDFQLLFTIPKEKIPDLAAGFVDGDDHGLFTVIGEITSNPGIIELVRDGHTEILEPKGYRHF
jgi:thiamine-monophosphate kinase